MTRPNVPRQLQSRALACRITRRATWTQRVRILGGVGLRMMLHDKAKLASTLLGVVFAAVLSNQQAGMFLGLIQKNVMFAEHAGADLWVLPPGIDALPIGRTISLYSLMAARTTAGVRWAEPVLLTGASFALADGSTETVQLVGVTLPECRGGPWNLVAGDCQSLRAPDTLIVESAERKNLGDLNLGSVREVSGRRAVVAGFTWGLLPFGPSYAFANYDTVREIGRIASDQTSFVLIGREPGVELSALKRSLQRRLPQFKVLTTAELSSSIFDEVMMRTSLGVTFGTSTLFGLLVGLLIVGLSMFSAVVDNVREFGMLKAIGCTNFDLALLLSVQSIAYALLGSLIGLALVTRMANGIRSAKLALVLPHWLTLGTVALMILLCLLASMLALLRVRKVEPAMVFR